MKPTIVICAYNRPKLLMRLLRSIERAKHLKGATLVVSLDYSTEQNSIVQILKTYDWVYGDLHIITHSTNIGLRNHILYCGDLTQEFGDIILLEEDLYVSPAFYKFSIDSIQFYKDEPRISGISLYNQCYCETSQLRFEKINHSNSDVYFMQLASSWGQIWTKNQWKSFKKWYVRNNFWTNNNAVPENIASWPESSWKKYFIKYNIENDFYFVYPRSSLSTNFCDPGTHHKGKRSVFQTPLESNSNRVWSFEDFHDSVALYDAGCELNAHSLVDWCGLEIEADQLEVDLYATKDLKTIDKEYLITTRESAYPLVTFALDLKPRELNIHLSLKGSEIVLAKTNSFSEIRTIDKVEERNYYHGLL